ncbi:hypothetical protein CN193_22115 [Sinorhizobium meliloti]|nr:hypothetical protein CN193_22115 [Sinorhizobium meliloti]
MGDAIMATLHWPVREHVARRYPADPLIPCLISASGDYPVGPNAYLQARCSGRVDPSDVTKRVLFPEPLAPRTNRQYGYTVCDFLTFCETEEAHPDLGVISSEDVKEWHILELYSSAMHRGLWTAAYFKKSTAQPLHPLSTINPRLKELMRCFLWMAANGYSENFQQEPDLEVIRLSLQESTQAFYPGINLDTSSKRNVRSSPGEMALPSPTAMIDWLNIVPRGVARTAAIGIHEHGFRIAEIAELLLPGRLHSRDIDQLTQSNIKHYKWTAGPLFLKHDLSDDQMIGVLPDRDHATNASVKCRIIGKGNKVRLVHLKPGWLTRVWQYCDTDRAACVIKYEGGRPPAHLLIGRDGKRCTADTLSKIFTRANRRASSSLNITAHVLRHIFACRFLQHAIQADARRDGYEIDELTREQIERYAELPLVVLQYELGHATPASTLRYLEMLIHSWIAPRYHNAWNSVLDQVD